VVAKGQVFGAATEGLRKCKGRRCISGRSEFAICALDDGLIFLGGRHRVLVTVLSSHASLRSSYQQLILQTRFTVNNWQSDFFCIAVIKRVEPWGGEHEFTAIVMRAFASCGRDLIPACDFDCCSIEVNADHRAGFGPSNFFKELVFFFRSLSCREEL